MSVTIKDIARETNISVATVARALKYPEKVNEKKRKLILATADKLGYIPNINACNLKTNTSTNIGFIINDVQNTFFNSLIPVVEKELSDNGYKLMISFGTEDKVEIEDKIKNFLSTSVCAILFSPNLHSNYIENLLKKKEVYTLQLFSKYYDCFDSLIVDDTNGTYLATKRLLHEKHEKIMLIGLNDVIWQERVKGYKKAIIEAGLKINENLIVTIDNSEFLVDKISTMIVKENVTSIIPIAGKIGVATI
jgi:LacI family transcriptional regulator